MAKKYFGTDGIRGAINSKNINGDMFFKFGLASGTYFKSQKKRKQTAIIAKILDYLDTLWNQHLFQDLHPQECMFTH